MSATTTSHQIDHLDSHIRAVWRRTQFLHLATGFLALCRWAISLFLLGMAVDWMTYMPTPGRAVIMGIVLAVPLYKAWQCGWRHLYSFDATHTALRIEKQHGGLESLLVSAIQLRDSGAVAGASEALRNRTCRLAEEAASDLHPRETVPYQPLRHPGLIALVLGVVIGGFAVVNGPFLEAGLTRIFTPWTTVAYPTRTKIDIGEGDLVVKEGERARIEVGVSGVVPDQAEFYLRTGDGNPREIELDVINGSCEYTLASASRDFSYRVYAGDARSDWHQVRVIPAPRIEKADVLLEFPAYIEREAETIEALTLTVPEDTAVHWQLTLDRPIREAVLHRDGMDPLPLEVSGDGRQVVINEKVEASRGYSFSWVEKEYGFDFTSSRYYLQVASDQAPRVELTSPESNLVAMVGRPLTLATRVHDDHGIGSAVVAYRVNQRDEESVELNPTPQSGQVDQPIDWDYRETLPDLETGDTVSFTLEVSDRYPGTGGPHVVRSETRRMTFLSKEDYLEQVKKKKDRLLSRVQTMYRQQRSAFDVVRNLEPADEGYMQTCQIEAIRQELVRDQLQQIAAQVQFLLDDLAANNVSDAPEGESLDHFRTALRGIADTHVAKAASLLRHQSGIAGGDAQETPDPSPAARAVNSAARELGSLVLLRSIDSAQEVYAREARMLAQVQASLRWRSVQAESAGTKRKLSEEQDEVAEWTHRLIADLQNGMRYEKRPLAVLRLIQSVKDLQEARTEDRMHQAAELITQDQADQVERYQAELVTTLLDAEFSVRLSGAYSTLLRTRDQLRSIARDQSLLNEQCAGMSAQHFEAQGPQAALAQERLRKRLLTLLLPTVPAPRTQLFDETFPEPPPVHALLKDADRAMADAIQHITSGKQDAAVSQQREAEQALTDLAGLVDRWSVDLGLQTLGLSTLVAVTGERLALIEEYEAKVIALLEKTDIAAADEQKVDGLAEPQLLLTEELAAFNSDLVEQSQSQADQDIPPLLSRTERAERALRGAVESLKANDADQAIGHQEQAADLLAEAMTIVARQNEQLGLLQSLLMFQRSVGFANRYMTDIVARQRDLIADTKALEETDDASHLLPLIAHLRRCIDDVAPLLDTVAARVDAGTPLAFAGTDLEDAEAALQAGDHFDALDAQDVVAESLDEVNTLVRAVRIETGYVAEIVEFLHTAVAKIGTLEYQQGELMLKAQSATREQFEALIEQQRKLLAAAEEEGKILESVTGMSEYAEVAGVMSDALSALKSDDATAAAEHMELAAVVLQESTESLFLVISMVHGLPSIEIMSFTDPDLKRLVEVLAVASAHKDLFRNTNSQKGQAIEALTEQQGELATRCQELSVAGEPHELLNTASSALAAAATAMESSDRDATTRNQKSAMQTLRHFIIEQALILETAVPPAAAEDGSPEADGPGSDSESAFAAGFIADFVAGEAPKDQRAEWKVRGERNRAALNQNFARELPLEYRGLLKDYYERVAE